MDVTSLLHVLSAICGFLSRNEGILISVVLPLALAVLKTTAWGKAHKQALLLVVQAVEDTQDENAKKLVANASQLEKSGVQAAIDNAVRIVDPGKTPERPAMLLLRELARGVK